MENSFEKLVDKSVDEAFQSLDVEKKAESENKIKKKLKKKIEKVLNEDENSVATVKIVADDEKTVEKVFDIIKFIERACNTDESKSILVKDSAGVKEWVFDGDGEIADVNVKYQKD